MSEHNDALADVARAKLRSAFAQQTTDWPEWFIGIDLTPTKSADATATILKPHGHHMHVPVVVWRNKQEKTNYFRSLPKHQANAIRVVLIARREMTLPELRKNLFDRLASLRKQYLYTK